MVLSRAAALVWRGKSTNKNKQGIRGGTCATIIDNTIKGVPTNANSEAHGTKPGMTLGTHANLDSTLNSRFQLCLSWVCGDKVKLGSRESTSPDHENHTYGRSSRVSCFPLTGSDCCTGADPPLGSSSYHTRFTNIKNPESINCAKKERRIRKVGIWFSVYS